MMGLEQRVRSLEKVVGELRERNRQLEAALVPPVKLPEEWRLDRQQVDVFRLLLARDVVTMAQLEAAIPNRFGEPASPVTIHGQISKIRRKTARHNVTITNSRNVGWSLKRRMEWRARLGLDQRATGIAEGRL